MLHFGNYVALTIILSKSTMSKRKKRPYTIAVFWKNINLHVPKYLNSSPDNRSEFHNELDKIVEEVNASSIPSSIDELFVKPYIEKTHSSVNFVCKYDNAEDNGMHPCTLHSLDESETLTVTIDSIALYKYADSFKKAETSEAASPEADFAERRQALFMKELSKLPDPYYIYLAVLQEIAYSNDIVSVEDREGNFHKSDVGYYLSMLWAFKEFETFYLRAQNRSLRADYSIIWHEGQWVQDSVRGRGYV